MKRGRRFLVLLAAGFFVCGGCLAAGVPVEDAAVEATEVLQIEVIALEGDVRVKPENRASFAPAEEGAFHQAFSAACGGLADPRGAAPALDADEEEYKAASPARARKARQAQAGPAQGTPFQGRSEAASSPHP